VFGKAHCGAGVVLGKAPKAYMASKPGVWKNSCKEGVWKSP